MTTPARFGLWLAALVCVLASGCDGPVSGTGPVDAGPADAGSVDASPVDAQIPDPVELASRRIDRDWLLARVETLADDSFEGRENLEPGGEAARDWLAAEMETMGLEPAGREGWRQPFPDGVNLAGRLPAGDVGDGTTRDVVVLVAHYDHIGRSGPGSACPPQRGDDICNGAVDNATGCAALLGVARAFAEVAVPRRRDLLFVFTDAEEDGLRGSRWFVERDPLVPLDDITVVFNVDAIGGEFLPGLPLTFVIGVESVESLRPLVWASNDGGPWRAQPAPAYFDGTDDGRRSDHYPFRQAGVPALFFSAGTPPEYHTPADSLDSVVPDKLEWTTRHLFRMTTAVANAPDRPVFIDDPRPHLDDARALLAVGEAVLANPGALGLEGSPVLGVAERWLVRLRAYLDAPPTDDAAWIAYEQFLRSVVDVVFEVLGR